MQSNEIYKCINVYMGLWPYAIKSEQHRDILFSIWERRYGDYDCNTLIDTLYKIDEEAETKQEPTTKKIMAVYKSLYERKIGRSGRRLVTNEETLCNLFHEEMKKPYDKRDYWLLDQIKWTVPLFEGEGWEERYKAHFGKYREEYEKL